MTDVKLSKEPEKWFVLADEAAELQVAVLSVMEATNCQIGDVSRACDGEVLCHLCTRMRITYGKASLSMSHWNAATCPDAFGVCCSVLRTNVKTTLNLGKSTTSIVSDDCHSSSARS